MRKLFLASNSGYKAREFSALAHGLTVGTDASPIEIVSASAIGGFPAVAEDAGTLIGNAQKKAAALQDRLAPGAWALADDSGLFVDALSGAPGVDSATYAGRHGDDAANILKLLDEMRRVPASERSARFICLLLVRGPRGVEETFEGACEGRLLTEARGTGGFGYDPIFAPIGFQQSFAEMEPEVKNRISHRAVAWAKLMRWLEARR